MDQEHAIFIGTAHSVLFFWHTYYGSRSRERLAEFGGDILNTLIAHGMVEPAEQIVVFSASASGAGITPVSARPSLSPPTVFTLDVLSDTLCRLIAAKRSVSDGYVCIRVTLAADARPQICELFVEDAAPQGALTMFGAAPPGPPPLNPLLSVVSLKPFVG